MRPPRAKDLCRLAAHDEGGLLVNADAQKLREPLDNCRQVGLALALAEMLVDGRPRQKGQAPLVAFGHHLAVTQWAAADEILGLSGRAGAGAADDSAATENVVQK